MKNYNPLAIKNNFRNWVPAWLQVTVAFIILVPVLLVNGAYVGSNIDIAGSLGVLSEDINMAYYVSSIGMAVSYIAIPKIKPIATAKTIFLLSLLAQVVLSYICARTAMMEIIIICSFWIGCFKGLSMIEVIGILMPYLAPSGTRNQFYAVFYPIVLCIGQLSLVITAELAYQYQWQHMYYFMIVLLLFAMLAIVICMAYARRLIRIPYKELDWLSLFLVSICMTCLIYVTTYGKVEDWFNSYYIIGATFLVPVTGWLFIRRQLIDTGKPPALDLGVLKHRNAVTVYITSFVMMFYVSFSLLVSTYVQNILHLTSALSNELYLLMIPGIVFGGLLAYYFYVKAVRMAWYIFLGFLCFTVAIGILYFKVDPMGRYEDLYLPMFLRGVGMLLLFVALAIYGVQGLERKEMLSNAFFMIGSRSPLAPAVGSSILSNWLYRSQQENITNLMQNVDFQNSVATSRFNASLHTAMAQGWSIEDAKRIASNAVYQTVQSQAALVSVKMILGWLLIGGIALLIFIVLYFFHFGAVRWISTDSDMTT